MKLYYLGKPGDGFGWGIANTNLVRTLSTLCELVVDDTKRDIFDAPVFVPIADSSLTPLRKIRKAPRVIGYCFTEWPLTDKAVRNARQYDFIFCGSHWNTAKLCAAGINHVETLHQGVDFDRFTPQPPSQRKGFVVFSGGKYEFRKGQDLVIAAMKPFMAAHPDAFLMCAWHNAWPQSMASMANSWYLKDWQKPFEGLPLDRVIVLPPVPNEKLPEIYAQAHLGLFPNRCEAGTNLVMCEFMACARPVIALNGHGQADVLAGVGPFRLDNWCPDPAGWCNPPVADILTQLEAAYALRAALPARGDQCRALIEPFTWEKCAAKITAALCGA